MLLPLQGTVWLVGEGVERREPIECVEIAEQLGSAPRAIRFADGAMCEVDQSAELEQWLEAIGHRSAAVDRLQRSTLIAMLAAVLVVLTGAAGYRWGLPWAAAELAQRTPPAVTRALADQTLELLDARLLQPSTLAPGRQAALKAAFERMDTAGDAQLLFRAGPSIGPNALALPDGRIVLIDELVALAQHDEETLAVLAHELGHVQRQHGMRLMIQGAMIGAFIAWWIGDFSPLIAAAPAAILQARHSRDLESEADSDAMRLLQAQGIASTRLADILERIALAHGEAPLRDDPASEPESAGWIDYLSSHPATRDRIRALRGERGR